jgi:hypothetical protein
MEGLPLTSDDLIPDEPLDRIAKGPISEAEDLLNHRVVASRVAELAATQPGRLNIALFGPWGSGKSSFYGLLKEELTRVDPKIEPVVFDAWRNAGPAFHANFLSELARKMPNADPKIAAKLTQSTRSVRLPFRDTFDRWRTGHTVLVILGALAFFFGIPLAWTLIRNAADPAVAFWPDLVVNVGGWVGWALGASVLVLILTTILELSKVTVEQSAPSHVTQFSELFDEVVRPGTRCVVFIDELDRCGPRDVMLTLEGLRTFLGHDRCIFVVAFDREAVSSTIAGHLRNTVPQREESPYYETSGEYLDKIFQFQISLPPQRVHTFRKYALSLIDGRGGLWGELRAHSERTLGRVVSILSPIHLTSPRRTKVLLNDFAVNVRVLERLGFDWLERAEEIAALTTLQTEFPQLAADVERFPALLGALAYGDEPGPGALRDVYASYRPRVDTAQPPPSPDIDSDAPAEGIAKELDVIVARNQDVGRRREVSARLAGNLDRYLRKLVDMRCSLPRADLVLMHSTGKLVSFESSDVYNALLLAGEAPRADTLAAIAEASVRDRLDSIAYLADDLEGETADLAEGRIILAGEIADTLDSLDADTAALLTGLWERSVDEGDLPAHLSPAGYRGYARAVAMVFDPDGAELFVDNAEDYASASIGEVLSILSTSVSDADLPLAAPVLVRLAARNVVRAPAATAVLIGRLDAARDDGIDVTSLDSQLATRLRVAMPAEVEPTAATSIARAAAQEANEAARGKYEGEVARSEASMREVLAGWDDLRPDGEVRPALLRALRTVGQSQSWGLDVHDELLARDTNAGRFEPLNNELLRAIAELPKEASARWISRLQPDAGADTIAARAALEAVVNRCLTVDDAAARTNGAANAKAIAPFIDPSVFDPDALLEEFESAASGEWEEFVEERFAAWRSLASTIAAIWPSATRVDSAVAEFYLSAVRAATPSDDLATLLDQLAREKPEILANLAEELLSHIDPDEAKPEDAVRLHVALVAQAGAGELSDYDPLSWEDLQSIVANPLTPLVTSWLGTGPAPADLKAASATLALSALPRAAWSNYSKASTSEQRADAWLELRRRRLDREVLRRVAEGGVPSNHYRTVAASIPAQTTIASRMDAVRELLTLPMGSDLVRAAIETVDTLTREARDGDAPAIAALLLGVEGSLTQRQRSQLKGRVGEWLGSTHSLSRGDARALESKGLLKPKPGLVQKLFGKK